METALYMLCYNIFFARSPDGEKWMCITGRNKILSTLIHTLIFHLTRLYSKHCLITALLYVLADTLWFVQFHNAVNFSGMVVPGAKAGCKMRMIPLFSFNGLHILYSTVYNIRCSTGVGNQTKGKERRRWMIVLNQTPYHMKLPCYNETSVLRILSIM